MGRLEMGWGWVKGIAAGKGMGKVGNPYTFECSKNDPDMLRAIENTWIQTNRRPLTVATLFSLLHMLQKRQ